MSPIRAYITILNMVEISFGKSVFNIYLIMAKPSLLSRVKRLFFCDIIFKWSVGNVGFCVVPD